MPSSANGAGQFQNVYNAKRLTGIRQFRLAAVNRPFHPPPNHLHE
jgi:hypothetical protein